MGLRSFVELQKTGGEIVMCKKIFVAQYNGIGDAIVNAPLILSMMDAPDVNKIFLCSNDMWIFLKNIIDKYNKLFLLPRNYRSLEFISNLQYFFHSNEITDIISYRRDEIKNPHFYKQYMDVLQANNMLLHCYEHKLSEQHIMDLHFYDLGRMLTILSGNFNPPESLQGWMNKYYPFNGICNRQSVGIYLGASVQNKRLKPNVWVEIVNLLIDRGKQPIFLRAITAEEKSYEDTIFGLLGSKMNNCHIIFISDFDALIDSLLHQMCGLVSCDTFIVHLAVSLNVKVFGIYISTDSKIYGPIADGSASYQSQSFYSCEFRNKWGNCNSWGSCKRMGCVDGINKDELTFYFNEWLNQLY